MTLVELRTRIDQLIAVHGEAIPVRVCHTIRDEDYYDEPDLDVCFYDPEVPDVKNITSGYVSGKRTERCSVKIVSIQ